MTTDAPAPCRQHLVLVPGHLCDAEQWAHQSRHLADVAEVMIGDVTRDDTIAGMAETVLAQAPQHFALAGLSMGGYVCFEIMRRQPWRVTHLALLDTTHLPDSADLAERRREQIGLCKAGRFAEIPRRMIRNMVHPSRISDAALTGAIIDMAERAGPDMFLRQQTAMIGREVDAWALADIAVPTLVLCGQTDPFTPEMHARMAVAIPGAWLAVVEDCGHMTTMERPETTTLLMREWLRAGPPQPSFQMTTAVEPERRGPDT